MSRSSTANSNAVTILTPHAASVEANRFIPRQQFADLPFWGDLKQGEQDTLAEEGHKIGTALMIEGMGELAAGAHLTTVHALLKPHEGAFRRFCDIFGKSLRTAYRYMEKYHVAQKTFAEPILRAAIARGIDLTHGRFVAAAAKLPPPIALAKSQIDGGTVNAYLNDLEEKSKQIKRNAVLGTVAGRTKRELVREIRQDPKFVLQQNYRFVKNTMSRMPSRQKRNLLDSLVGMLLTEVGISSATLFQPEAIPDAFRQGPGRPRLVQKAVTPARQSRTA